MRVEVRKISQTEYEIDVEDVKLVSARIPLRLYQLLEAKTKNKSEYIRRVITEILKKDIDLGNISLDLPTEKRNKIITFRVQYAIYKSMVEHAQRYESVNEFVNRAIWWSYVVGDRKE